MEHMNEGVKIILERLKTNPEDFVLKNPYSQTTKWSNLLSEALTAEFLSEEEKKELQEEVYKSNRDSFTARVMQTLLVQDEPSDLGKLYHMVQNATVTGGQTLVGSSGNAMWGTSSLEHTALHIEALQKLAEAKTQAEKTMLQRLKEKIF
jgi:hypothetical protein